MTREEDVGFSDPLPTLPTLSSIREFEARMRAPITKGSRPPFFPGGRGVRRPEKLTKMVTIDGHGHRVGKSLAVVCEGIPQQPPVVPSDPLLIGNP